MGHSNDRLTAPLIPWIGGQNHIDQISDKAIHKTESLDSHWSTDGGDFQAAAPDLYRISCGFPGEHDWRFQNRRHCASHDRWKFWIRDGHVGIFEYSRLKRDAGKHLRHIDPPGSVSETKHLAGCEETAETAVLERIVSGGKVILLIRRDEWQIPRSGNS